jgi:hypothetical protein
MAACSLIAGLAGRLDVMERRHRKGELESDD